MLTRAAKQILAQREQHRAERYERIGRQTPPPTLHKATVGGTTQAAEQSNPVPKLTRRQKVRQDIRDSAKGEECLMRLPLVCMHDPEGTIWSHARWPWAGKGTATKAVDVAGAYACTACDAAYDGQREPPPGWTREEVDAEWHRAHLKSLVRLAEKGLL